MSNCNVFTIPVPRYDELCCIRCQPDIKFTENSICKTSFHAQVLMCRYIIHSIPEAIASPTENGSFIVMVTNKYYTEGNLQATLQRCNVTFETAKKATIENYERCLKYTIHFKLAPSWNVVDRYLIQGRYFLHNLSEMSVVSGVSMNILVGSEKITLKLQTIHLKFTPVRTDHQLNSFGQGDAFINNQRNVKSGVYRTLRWVHVLPSMKSAKVISISKTIPATNLFKKYEEFYSHWRNMYGYILPKDPSNIQYYTVYFPYAPGNQFTYPDVCLLKRPVQIVHLQCHTVDKTVDFINDFKKAVHSICGTKTLVPTQTLSVLGINDVKALVMRCNAKYTAPSSEEFNFKFNSTKTLKTEVKEVKISEFFSPDKKSLLTNGPVTTNIPLKDKRNNNKKRKICSEVIPNNTLITTFFKEKKTTTGQKMPIERKVANEDVEFSKQYTYLLPTFVSKEIQREKNE